MMNKKYFAAEELGYEDMSVKVLPVTKYDETTANVDLCTDFIAFNRQRYGIMFGNPRDDMDRWGCPNWWFNRFVGSRSGRPMRLTKAYMVYKYGDVSKIKDFEERRVLEQFSSYPGLSDNTHKKLDEGILFKGHEAAMDSVYMATNSADVDGVRMNYIYLDVMPKSLKEAYLAVVHKRNWQNVIDLLEAYQKKVPGFTFFKAGMNVIEQTLAHLDSAGYYIARVLDRNRDKISGAASVRGDYVCSFNFRSDLEKKYGKETVAHYFDDILVSRTHANELKMCYFM